MNIDGFLLMGTFIILASSADADCVVGGESLEKNSAVLVTCSGKNITSVPQSIPKNVTELFLRNTAIQNLNQSDFKSFRKLTTLSINHDYALLGIDPHTFTQNPELRFIEIRDCTNLKTIDDSAFVGIRKLRHMEIVSCGLMAVPRVHRTSDPLDELDFSQNPFEVISNRSFDTVVTANLRLINTGLHRIEDFAFTGAIIQKIVLKNNAKLTDIRPNAFKGIEGLKYIDLSSTHITSLPFEGLQELRELLLQDTRTLRKFPPTFNFHKMEKAHLTYAHHCCAFQKPDLQHPKLFEEFQKEQQKIREECPGSGTTLQTTKASMEADYRYKRHAQEWDSFQAFIETFPGNKFLHHLFRRGFGEFRTSTDPPHGRTTSNPWGAHKENPDTPENNLVTPSQPIFLPGVTIPRNHTILVKCGDGVLNRGRPYHDIECTPQPDAFNPCEDVMGYTWLRVMVWFVLLAALLGNLLVIIVLLHSWQKMSVSKFLMCNLAFADLMMGLYLLLLASFDAHTLGKYFNFAIEWQYEGGCQAAGFITVFASELSVYTLSVITLERWYAISHAIHLTKRLRLKQAALIMFLGWIFAIIMAMLPVIGVSDYGTTSICLPFGVEAPEDLGYLVFAVGFNGLAFIIICVCYISMYCKVSGSDSTARSSDATIAKKMAILVFTDFACWAPIAFFAFTAVGGTPLIDITNSKILLVFFYPLNSCANPFLYAIFTKQFRKDFLITLSYYGLCTKRASRMKASYNSNHMSMSQTRNSLGAIHNVHHHPSDGSILTQFTTDGTGGPRSSIKNSPTSTPKSTPQNTPKASPKGIKKAMNGILKTRGSGSSNHSSSSGCSVDSKLDPQRKLSIVPESSHSEADNDQEELVPKSELGNGDVSKENMDKEDLKESKTADEKRSSFRKLGKVSKKRKCGGTPIENDSQGSDNTAFHMSTSEDFIAESDSELLEQDDLNHNHSQSFHRKGPGRESGISSVSGSPNVDCEQLCSEEVILRRKSTDRESGFHSQQNTPVSSLSKKQFFDLLMKSPEVITQDTKV
ncbi:thyrotropin receptor [Lingula anatina]|uniref:Thyrotropin receptor n=1 Tax=Lingula anatina TaxID=7574 RepID=A0A1S3IAF5_LINAN|nr:thyrotropin receptor [Lingula anatina]|eukprot:XP_013394389.1 thyrotropin receptor [Lingula anatina]